MSNLFVRKATGMVRSWSVFDAFIYAFFSINLVTLGFYSFSQMYYFSGGMIPALIVSAMFIIFEIVVYASLISVMPRSGGDYVWQTRIFGGGVGFILSITGWWFTLWLWTPIYGDMLRQIVITPLLGAFGMKQAAVWFAGPDAALFVCSLLALLFVVLVIFLGMKTYARIQKYSFYAGVLGLLIVIALLFTGSPDAFKAGLDSNSAAYFGTSSGLFDATVETGIAAGAGTPITGGSFFLIMLTLPYLVFFNLWPNWGATLYGEVRGATDYKRNFSGMAWALIVTTVLGILFFLGINKSIGWDFYVQANASWWNYAWGYTTEVPPLPVWPNPAMLAVFLTDNRLIQIIVLLLMSTWWFGWAGTLFLSSTRVIFAAAFDRLLPESAAELNKNGTPVNAMLYMVIPAVVVSALYAFNVGGFKSITLAATQGIAIMYFGTAIAAIILPYKKKELFEASPIAKMKVGGIPLITIAGLIFGGFLLFLLVEWFFDPWLNPAYAPVGLYGISLANTNSIIFLGSCYAIAAIIYYSAKSRRKKEGIDLDKVQAEIPAE
ncbi:MAG: Amino acid permease superfamily protein [Chloroflexi bacterium OLB14]|nr:MAG: Amino acid permease superfamily protein [Chloroflexi bacterium OLB14]